MSERRTVTPEKKDGTAIMVENRRKLNKVCKARETSIGTAA